MNAIRDALVALHQHEQDLAKHLRDVSHRHERDPEVHHVALDLSAWSAEHVRRLARIARGYGATLDPAAPQPGLLTGLSGLMSKVTPRADAPGLLLLHDLETTYLMAAHCSLQWEMVAQVALAKRDADLVGLASDCHPQTLRQQRWCNTLIKTLAPQVLSAAS